MSSRKSPGAWQKTLRSCRRQVRVLAGVVLYRLGWAWLAVNRGAQEGGFILPTVMLTILFTALVVAALVFQATNQVELTVGNQQMQVVYNSATPAIDRAKAKLERVFDEDLSGATLPTDGFLFTDLLSSRYTLPDETALDYNGNGIADDLAWAYRVDMNGDGVLDGTTGYVIVLRVGINTASAYNPGVDTTSSTDPSWTPNRFYNDPFPPSYNTNYFQTTADPLGNKLKALYQVIENGPLVVDYTNSSNCTLASQSGNTNPYWSATSSSQNLKKTFQVFATTIPDSSTQGTIPPVKALKYQQDRTISQPGKWGAWFRHDLEIYPGPDFNWNGAVHSEGNIYINSGAGFRSYLISSGASCYFNPKLNSEVSTGGHLATGSVRDGNYSVGSGANFDIWPGTTLNVALTPSNDSLAYSVTNAYSPIQAAINPMAIVTQDLSLSRAVPALTGEGTATREMKTLDLNPAWNSGTLINRVNVQTPVCPPYVDDFYRADNIYGPKPSYTRPQGSVCTPILSGTIGTAISPTTNTDLTLNIPTDLTDPESVGLDGYWERRARLEGLRVIVGQRLELGNAYGWGLQLSPDPLYPAGGASFLPSTLATAPSSDQQRQRRQLRDNLAAVQSTAIYHYTYSGSTASAPGSGSHPGGFFPVACLATTAHPGTSTSITNSTTFSNLTLNGTSTTITDFLTGNGTNGWEFPPPAGGSESTFTTNIANNQPLGKALRNLAYFAGDPVGSFPPQQDVSGSTGAVTHPYPMATMWGDFSNLRRVVTALDAGSTYPSNWSGPASTDISLADATTLQTAACTLGMLAYHLSTLNSYSYTNTGNSIPLANLNLQIARLTDKNTRNGEVANVATDEWKIYNASGTVVATVKSTLADALIAGLAYTTSMTGGDLRPFARFIHEKEQVARDIANGFTAADSCNVSTSYTDVELLCPSNSVITTNFAGIIGGGGSLSSVSNHPKFPALYYLFPTTAHGQTNGQPSTEPYIADSYMVGSSVNGPATNTTKYNALSAADVTSIALTPRTSTSWVLPRGATSSYAGGNNSLSPANTITDSTSGTATSTYVPFLDKGIFNGRQMMLARVLDFDINLLRSSQIGGDFWFATNTDTGADPYRYGGIVYAFREDGLREDGLLRPAITDWNSYLTWYNSNPTGNYGTSTTNLMNANGRAPQDPPVCILAGTAGSSLNGCNDGTGGVGISTKSIDYYADPDRKVHGFRLRNGQSVRRLPTPSNDTAGISFISDNPVYVQGDFNLHSTNETTSNLIEEFTDYILNGTYTNFYNRSVLSTVFAVVGSDTWRTVEVLADAVVVLYKNFVDGTIQDTFVAPGTTTSYLNQNLPTSRPPTGYAWARENPTENYFSAPVSPVLVDRNGVPQLVKNTSTAYNAITAYGGGYYLFSNGKALMRTSTMHVNMTMANGINPPRSNQDYGGLHNFPRFLENWGGQNLIIAGSMLQLNYSNYATGNYDQQAWEPGTAVLPIGSGGQQINYYGAPNRDWGYDVALQYVSAGPLSRRLFQIEPTRDEFYQEVDASNTPYICRLRRAGYASGNGGYVDSSATSTTCPT